MKLWVPPSCGGVRKAAPVNLPTGGVVGNTIHVGGERFELPAPKRRLYRALADQTGVPPARGRSPGPTHDGLVAPHWHSCCSPSCFFLFLQAWRWCPKPSPEGHSSSHMNMVPPPGTRRTGCTLGGTRTRTVQPLRLMPLPIGLRGRKLTGTRWSVPRNAGRWGRRASGTRCRSTDTSCAQRASRCAAKPASSRTAFLLQFPSNEAACVAQGACQAPSVPTSGSHYLTNWLRASLRRVSNPRCHIGNVACYRLHHGGMAPLPAPSKKGCHGMRAPGGIPAPGRR